jgi:lipopolysaccharide export LptBFGC system permease protein LptF
LALGLALGYSLRRKRGILKVEKLVLAIILALIFSLGFSIGSNSELLAVMPSIWLNALVLLVMALLFSVLFAKAAVKLVKI